MLWEDQTLLMFQLQITHAVRVRKRRRWTSPQISNCMRSFKVEMPSAVSFSAFRWTTTQVTVSKDVIGIEYEHDRVPSKAENIEPEKSKRVISGFEGYRE